MSDAPHPKIKMDMECGRDGHETGKYVTDVFRENALKKKEE